MPIFWFFVSKVKRQDFGALIKLEGLSNTVALQVSCDLTGVCPTPMHQFFS